MYDIYHSGIKGQRKGVRRFQYANKTYTPAGNERYRPKKASVPTKVAIGATGAVTAAAWAHAFNSATGFSVLASTALSHIASNAVLLGAEVVAGFAAIPVPVYAITIPMALMMAPQIIDSGKDYIEEWKNRK